MFNIRDYACFTQYGQRTVGMAVLEIKSLPSFQLLYDSDQEAVAHVKQAFSILLNEFAGHGGDSALSAEIVWSCEPAINQPFASFLKLNVVFRAVGLNEYECSSVLQEACAGFVTAINGLKIVSSFVNPVEYQKIISSIGSNQVYAVKRTEDVIGFNMAMFPYCYKYDAITPFEIDLDVIVNTLINERNSHVIIQLISTRYNNNERMYVSNCVNALGTLAQGTHLPRMGFYKDTRAETPLRSYKKCFDQINSPVFLMNVFVCGETQKAQGLATKTISLLADSKAEIAPAYETINVTAYNRLPNLFVSPWEMLDVVMSVGRDNIRGLPIFNAIARLPFLYSAAEAAQVFRLPIGTKKITAGITIHEMEKRNKRFADGIINVSQISVGKLQNVIGAENDLIGLNKKDLTKHMLVVGTPGSGKSTFLVGLMDRLWKQNVPFLVIEPAKNEYRSLIQTIPELQVFSPGKNNIAPFVMNPFVPPKGVTIEKYKSIVKAAFATAFEMWTPLDQLFDETLNICYSEQGWLDSTIVEDSSDCFSLVDFIKVYKEVVGSKGYSGEYKKQVEAAGVLRLNGLLEQNVNIFDSRYSVPVEDILKKPTVIELSNIKDIKQKSFIIALLLNNIYAYVEANNKNDGDLQNVILLEEAHALLAGEIGGQGDGPSANAAAVRLLADMLAEIRSRGVGIVIADQSPQKVTSNVIANTNAKLMFRLVEAEDKEIVKRSTTMTDLQRDRLSKLRCGQALFFFDKLDEVEEVLLDDYRSNNGISIDLSDQAVKEKMTYWDSNAKLLMPYRDCDFIEGCKGGCDVQIREKARVISDRIFRKYNKYFEDREKFSVFYKGIASIIKGEILEVFKDEKLVDTIGGCVRVHFLRKVHYYTDLNVNLETRKKTYQINTKK